MCTLLFPVTSIVLIFVFYRRQTDPGTKHGDKWSGERRGGPYRLRDNKANQHTIHECGSEEEERGLQPSQAVSPGPANKTHLHSSAGSVENEDANRRRRAGRH